MTRIPDDHQASRALQEEFERLGRERARARVPSRRRPGGRAIASAIAAVLAAAAAATAATGLLEDRDTVRREPHKLPPSLEGAPADRRLSPVRVPDPGGGLPWGARTYTSELGLSCVVIGRVRGDRLGVVRDGRFVPFGDRAPGACGTRPSQHLVVQVRRASDPAPGRSVLYGVADRAVRSLILEGRGGEEPIRIGSDGVFLHVRAGSEAFRGASLVSRVAGRVRRSRLLR